MADAVGFTAYTGCLLAREASILAPEINLCPEAQLTRFSMNTNGLLKRCLTLVAGLLLVLSCAGFADDDKAATEDQTDIAKRLDAAANVLNEIMGAPDNGIPDNILGDAKCIAVVPSMVKFALGVGGQHGKGVATCRTATGWSAPAPITITGGSFGFQIGGQATDLIMVVMNQKGMDHLLSSKFKIGADASAAAGPVGRHAAADTDWKMKAEVLSYSRSRGAFAGIDLSGAAVKQEKDETHILYGKMVPFETILSGKVPAPKESHSFLATLEKYAPTPTQRGSLNTNSESK
jgi:lipid-binding SYLF domain-containing protein